MGKYIKSRCGCGGRLLKTGNKDNRSYECAACGGTIRMVKGGRVETMA